MPGDTYTPPRHDTTVFGNDDVLEFRKAREDLEPQSQIQAKREALSAYEQISATPERAPTPVEYAAMQLAELHKARSERMAA